MGRHSDLIWVLLEGDDFGSRELAAQSLGKIGSGGMGTVPLALKRAMSDKSPQVRAAAEKALVKVDRSDKAKKAARAAAAKKAAAAKAAAEAGDNDAEAGEAAAAQEAETVEAEGAAEDG